MFSVLYKFCMPVVLNCDSDDIACTTLSIHGLLKKKMFPFDNIVGKRTVQCRCYIQRNVTKLECIIF